MHMKTHIRHEVVHQCKYCQKCFSERISLVTHIETHLTKQKLLGNEHFQESSTHDNSVKVHMSSTSTHSEQKPYQCKYCSQYFAIESSLTKHTTHLTPNQYQCEYCQKYFSVESLLKEHIKTHKKEEKLYQCEFYQ